MIKQPVRIAVLGSGSWATAMIKMFAANTPDDRKIYWYVRNPETVSYIRQYHHNPKYLSSVELDMNKLIVTDNAQEAVQNADLLVFVIPSAFLKQTVEQVKGLLADKYVVSGIKGIVPDENLIVGEYFNQHHNVALERFAVITGPCHAEEVALERLSYLTIASPDLHVANLISELVENRFIKTAISDDIYGTEYGAVLKNIFALAAGICHGLGYGDNFQAVLISNAIQEIKRFVDTVHPINRDINASAYLGDLLVTAYSNFSRNRTFGMMIGKGYSVKAAQMEMNMIAEGYFASYCIAQINSRYNINMPICNAVYNILYQGKPPAYEIKLLTDKIR